MYRKFIPTAQLLCLLTNSLKGSPSANSALSWSADMKNSFSAAKLALSSATELSHSRAGLVCDASATHVGAALQQRRQAGQAWEPLGFFSKKLDKPQLVYSAFDRELFAAFAAVRHFWYQLEGRQFQLWINHKPLVFALKKVNEAWTPRQQRQLPYLAEYTTDIRHVTGIENVIADALSRPPGLLSSDHRRWMRMGVPGPAPLHLHLHQLWPASSLSSLLPAVSSS